MLSQLLACGHSWKLREHRAGELGVGELELWHHLEEPLLVLPVGLLQAQDVGVVFLGIFCGFFSLWVY